MTWANGHRTIRSRTDLNRSTDALYHRCVSNGGHVASGETVRRWFPGTERELPVCARCRCPYGAPRQNWSSGTSRGRGPRLR